MSSRRLRPVSTWFLILIISLVLIFGFSFSHSAVSVTHAQDTASPSPSGTPDLERDRLARAADLAKLKQDKAEADQKTAEARKAEFEAKFPKPSTSPLEGKTTVEGAVIESQMISYVSLARAANRILEAIHNDVPSGGTLAIYNEQDVNSMLSYQVAKSQVNELIRNGYCDILTAGVTNGVCPLPAATPCPTETPKTDEINKEAAAPPPALPFSPLAITESFLGAFVDMTALLRTNVEIKGQTFAIDEAPLAAEIFRCARGDEALFEEHNSHAPKSSSRCAKIEKLTLYYPDVFPPNVNKDEKSPLLGLLQAAHKLDDTAQEITDAIEQDSKGIEKAEADLKNLDEAIGTTLPNEYLDALNAAGIAIRANCPMLSKDVQSILAHPDNQSEAMKKLIDKAIKVCPRMGADKVAQLLGMQKTIGDIVAELARANKAEEKTKNTEKDLKTDLKAQLDKLKLKRRSSGVAADIKDDATAAVAQLKGLHAQFDNLVTALTQPQAGGLNPLTNYIRTERLNSALKTCDQNKSFWLVVQVINAGGNNRIKTNLLVDVFRGGNRISHSGGVIAQYHLFASDGTSIRSGTVSDYTNYINAEKINQITGSTRQ